MPSFPDRLKKSRIVQAMGVYAASAWIVLEVVGLLRENLGLPRSVFVAALVLLAIGLVVVVATAWVQSGPGLAEAWGLWHRAGGEPALSALEAAHDAARTSGEAGAHLSEILALALERTYTDLGRHEDALPYARSHRADPFATFRTARLYEALGRDEEARRLYPVLQQAWNEADAGVPEVEEMRKRVGR